MQIREMIGRLCLMRLRVFTRLFCIYIKCLNCLSINEQENKAGYLAIQSQTVGPEQLDENRSIFKNVTERWTEGLTDTARCRVATKKKDERKERKNKRTNE